MFDIFKLTADEYDQLETKFGDLCKFEAWQLKRNNSQNNVCEDVDDFIQDLRIALMLAGVYYKRQVYIENCLRTASYYAKDNFLRSMLKELRHLWRDRTRHGANKQKFGKHQEKILDNIVFSCVPEKRRPNPNNSLKIDQKFTTYCKQITWNKQKSLGKRITKERTIRSGMTSLSDYDYLANSITASES